MSVESPAYTVLIHDGSFEVREYQGYMTANVTVSAASHGEAANYGFNALADFIFGNNHAAEKVPMTAPVSTQKTSQKISMTVPVSAVRSGGSEYTVSFTMPSSYTIDTLPVPNNRNVIIEEIPPHTSAAVRFSGYLNASNQAEHRADLEAWIAERGLTPVGEPIVAQYDAPWKPWFARRNEVLIPVEAPA